MSARAERVAAEFVGKAVKCARVADDYGADLWATLADLVEAGQVMYEACGTSTADPWAAKLAALAKALGVEGE